MVQKGAGVAPQVVDTVTHSKMAANVLMV